jgi:DNA-binding NarL/FixJ family response regulator
MPIRILLAQIPRVLQETLGNALSRQPDMIVTRAGNHVEVLLAAGETRADVVVIGMEDTEPPGIASHLLEEYPSLRIIVVDLGDQRALLYELRPELVPIGKATSAQLPSIIRAAVRSQRSE